MIVIIMISRILIIDLEIFSMNVRYYLFVNIMIFFDVVVHSR